MESAASTEQLPLFVYGSLLRGERDHHLLEGATFLRAAATKPSYTLVELGSYAALIAGGTVSVAGELYLIDKRMRFTIDVARQYPALFQRFGVTLDDGAIAETYGMHEHQVRGKRRIKHGSWRDRFAPRARGQSW